MWCQRVYVTFFLVAEFNVYLTDFNVYLTESAMGCLYVTFLALTQY